MYILHNIFCVEVEVNNIYPHIQNKMCTKSNIYKMCKICSKTNIHCIYYKCMSKLKRFFFVDMVYVGY